MEAPPQAPFKRWVVAPFDYGLRVNAAALPIPVGLPPFFAAAAASGAASNMLYGVVDHVLPESASRDTQRVFHGHQARLLEG